jgi:hypothetical protein
VVIKSPTEVVYLVTSEQAIKDVNSELTKEEKEPFVSLCQEYSDMFHMKREMLQALSLFMDSIQLRSGSEQVKFESKYKST